MKKTVSINIGSVVFHIEEDAYEKLKKYLADIGSYFSKYEDSKEILSDIESRIAEIFLKKLKGKKESLNMSDVDGILKTMGSVKDFQMEGADDQEEETTKGTTEAPGFDESYGTKKLYRDMKRKILGGVCAGIANYLKIDPLWIRLVFLAPIFGIWFFPPFGISFIAYLILWAILPGSGILEEDKSIKKLFRNPEERVIGGVSSGIAAYFGTDTWIIRLLFFIGVFLGFTGPILYVLLWMITPEAFSTTDKMKMRGEPVTLTNIETAVKKSFKVKPEDEENIFVKIVLFPFRIIGQVFEALARLLGPLMVFLVEAIRVLAGLLLVLISFSTITAMSIALLFVLGFPMGQDFMLDGIPFSMIDRTIPTVAAMGVYLAGFVPFFAIGLLGIRFLVKRPIFNTAFLWSLFGVWMIGIIMSAVSLPKIAFGFSESNRFEKSESIPVPGPIVFLNVDQIGMEDYEGVRLRIRPHEKEEMELEYEFSATGYSRSEALKNAKAISYSWKWKADTVMVFDSNIELKADALFRNQELDMTLFMPIGQKFILPYDIRPIIHNTIYHYGYNLSDLKGNTFYFSDMETLECDGCDTDSGSSSSAREKEILFNAPFTSIDISGHFNIVFIQGPKHSLKMEGKEENIADVEVKTDDEELEISYDPPFRGNPSEKSMITLIIQSPNISKIEVTGYNKLEIKSLEAESLLISLAGKIDAEAELNVNTLEIELEGNSSFTFQGKGNVMEADLSGVSELQSENFEADDVSISTSGTSEATVYSTSSLDAVASGVSKIFYSGNPQNVKKDNSGLSKISRR
jgi:phage shock protein PspC (stress-responsive transcriptional regulator)